MAEYLSRHFTVQEMTCRCGCGDHAVQPGLLDRLERMRAIYGAPMTPTSAKRCDDYAARVGIGKGDAHNLGWAVDIATRSGRERFAMLNAAREAGFRRLGIGRDFIHVDCGPEGLYPQDVIWDYYQRAGG